MSPRPPMPEPVKRAVLYLNMRKNGGKLICEETGDELTEADILGRKVHVDHVPALALRVRDEFGNYHPAANDLNHLEIVSAIGHIHRTAKRRGLFRGDQTEIARSRKVRQAQADHEAAMAAKTNGSAKPKSFKKKIQSRGFDKTFRKPMRGPAVRRHT